MKDNKRKKKGNTDGEININKNFYNLFKGSIKILIFFL